MTQVISFADWQRKRDELSTSNAQSKQNTRSVEPGPTHTKSDAEIEVLGILLSVLLEARTRPFTTKSDFARMAATEIALLASEGLLSTEVAPGNFTNKWMVTEACLEWMTEVVHDLSD